MAGADLSEADLTGAELYGTDLRQTDLHGVELGGAYLYEADLSDADLHGGKLIKAYLGSAHLHGVNLREAILAQAALPGADLSNADLSEAILPDVNLSRADLSNADLSNADLTGANLSGAILTGTNLYGATVEYAVFADVDLTHVKGLENARHGGPSSIGIDTIYKSRGNIPHVFLRGCGVPDNFIEYMASLTGKTFEYYSCFISYSSKDEELARLIHDNLQGQGVRCWFAPEDMKIGDRMRPRIDEAIRLHDKLLLILSQHSVESDWVEKEVETAFEQERRRKSTVLFPIRLDDTVMDTEQAWAADIRRTRHIGDFRGWKNHDAYQKAFDRLLRDLKADQTNT